MAVGDRTFILDTFGQADTADYEGRINEHYTIYCRVEGITALRAIFDANPPFDQRGTPLNQLNARYASIRDDVVLRSIAVAPYGELHTDSLVTLEYGTGPPINRVLWGISRTTIEEPTLFTVDGVAIPGGSKRVTGFATHRATFGPVQLTVGLTATTWDYGIGLVNNATFRNRLRGTMMFVGADMESASGSGVQGIQNINDYWMVALNFQWKSGGWKDKRYAIDSAGKPIFGSLTEWDVQGEESFDIFFPAGWPPDG